jgi:hypothetical protein
MRSFLATVGCLVALGGVVEWRASRMDASQRPAYRRLVREEASSSAAFWPLDEGPRNITHDKVCDDYLKQFLNGSKNLSEMH